jgi:hypothetical protein
MVRDQFYPRFCSSMGSTLYFRFLGQAVEPCSTDPRVRSSKGKQLSYFNELTMVVGEGKLQGTAILNAEESERRTVNS